MTILQTAIYAVEAAAISWTLAFLAEPVVSTLFKKGPQR